MHVIAVHRSDGHRFTKSTVPKIKVIAGVGVADDVHSGATVRHRSRVALDPTLPNLRQVHLIAAETLNRATQAGFEVAPGNLGENITTSGVDYSALGVGTSVRIGDVLLTITGLRNPCGQIDGFASGLRSHLSDEAMVMAVAVHGGEIATGDDITIAPAAGAPIQLDRV